MYKLKQMLCMLWILFLMLSTIGCTTAPDTTDKTTLVTKVSFTWNLYGAWITEGSEHQETIVFSVSGQYPVEVTKHAPSYIDLNIQWPNTSHITNNGNQTCAGYMDEYKGSELFVCPSYMYIPHQNESFLAVSYLCLEKQLFFLKWGDEDSRILVASTNPSADLSFILKEYQEFLMEPTH